MSAVQTRPLLGPGDPPPVTVLRPGATRPVLVLCDHASNAVPSGIDLGVPAGEMRRHVAFDIGGRRMAERLSERLGATAVFSSYSRLVMDLNRPPGDPTSTPAVSDGTVVPANRDVPPDEVARRADALYRPYHDRVAAEIRRLSAGGAVPAIVSVHSFTPVMHGFRRPWQVGLLWDWDPRMAVPMIARLLRRGDLCVGDNQPYSGRGMVGHTIDVHCTAAGLPNALVEVRQDLVATDADADRWADLLSAALVPVLDDPALRRIERFGPP